MIAAAALLFAVSAAPCDVGDVLRVIAKSSLPPRTARNVAAKVRWAETACKAASIAPVRAQEELRIARDWAHTDRSVTRAIDGAIYTFDHLNDLPARITIHAGHGSYYYTVDSVTLIDRRDPLTVQLRAGTHEISVRTMDLREASATVTLAEGEPRSIELTPVEPPQNAFYIVSLNGLVRPEQLATFCISAYSHTGAGAYPTELENVTIEKRGAYDVTDLFSISGSFICAKDADALRDILNDSGPFTIRVRACTLTGQNVAGSCAMTYGRDVVVRGTVPESIRSVVCGGHRVPVNGGRFEIRIPEGSVDLAAFGEKNTNVSYWHRAEFHCDAEVRLMPEILEFVRGGCPGASRAEWRQPPDAEMFLEEVQVVTLVRAYDTFVPGRRYVAKTLPPEAHNEEWMRRGYRYDIPVRAYSENGTLVYRTLANIPPDSGGDFVVSQDLYLDLPLTARYIEVAGKRFDLKEFR